MKRAIFVEKLDSLVLDINPAFSRTVWAAASPRGLFGNRSHPEMWAELSWLWLSWRNVAACRGRGIQRILRADRPWGFEADTVIKAIFIQSKHLGWELGASSFPAAAGGWNWGILLFIPELGHFQTFSSSSGWGDTTDVRERSCQSGCWWLPSITPGKSHTWDARETAPRGQDWDISLKCTLGGGLLLQSFM